MGIFEFPPYVSSHLVVSQLVTFLEGEISGGDIRLSSVS